MNNPQLILNENMVDMSHQLLSQLIVPGDVVVDATCGRGRDTLFLAQAVGAQGLVHAFDIQSEAICDTASLLDKNGAAGQVVLHQADHSRIKEFVSKKIKVAVFNLGFLPGGDQLVKTMKNTTVKAIGDAISLLLPGGMILVVAYPGHEGGDKEKEAVEMLLAALPSSEFRVVNISLPNKREAPCLFYAVKIREETR